MFKISLRAHLNDLENVVPYILVSLVYTLTNPFPIVAINLFRVAVAFRIWHTFCYALVPIRQPARLIGFLIPCLVTIYMAVQGVLFFFQNCSQKKLIEHFVPLEKSDRTLININSLVFICFNKCLVYLSGEEIKCIGVFLGDFFNDTKICIECEDK